MKLINEMFLYNIYRCSEVDTSKKFSISHFIFITMNNQQRDLIDETIRSKSFNNHDVSDYIADWQETMEPFIVKNLETVQGDERDYIFISTLFGPNKDGNVKCLVPKFKCITKHTLKI